LFWNKAPIWGLRPDFYYYQTVAGLLMWGALFDERAGVVYNCSWPSPAQAFSGPTPLRLVTIIYCLRFETSLFVASYDSQSYGGGIRPHLHTRWLSRLTCTPDVGSRRTGERSPPSIGFSPYLSNPLPSITGETVHCCLGNSRHLAVTAETPTKVGFCGNAFSEAVA
jgi:hypothetical protein